MVALTFGLISALAYTAANIFLRAAADQDPVWVSCVKAAPTVAFVAPWLLFQSARGRKVLPAGKIILALAIAGLVAQLGGNVLFQWALSAIGLALVVPLNFGAMLITSAVLGRMVLQEPITSRAAAAVALLLASIVVLSVDARANEKPAASAQTVDTGKNTLQFDEAQLAPQFDPRLSLPLSSTAIRLLGVFAACLSGVAYSILGVTLRFGVTGKSSAAAAVFIVALVGLSILGAVSYARFGEQLWRTPPTAIRSMVQAGVFNALAFFSLAKALEHLTIFYVNALNASQVAMAAVAGVVFFHETATGVTVFGVGLTIVGMLMMRNKRRKNM